MRKPKDITGHRFWKLIAKKRLGLQGKSSLWLCLCDCGNETQVQLGHLLEASTKSCGCYRKKHGNCVDYNTTSEYDAWQRAKARCYNPRDPGYKNYGGRGIRMCERWLNSSKNFLTDMGKKPQSNLTLDRIDNDKGYTPDNCRWATYTEQNNNKRKKKRLTY